MVSTFSFYPSLYKHLQRGRFFSSLLQRGVSVVPQLMQTIESAFKDDSEARLADGAFEGNGERDLASTNS